MLFHHSTLFQHPGGSLKGYTYSRGWGEGLCLSFLVYQGCFQIWAKIVLASYVTSSISIQNHGYLNYHGYFLQNLHDLEQKIRNLKIDAACSRPVFFEMKFKKIPVLVYALKFKQINLKNAKVTQLNCKWSVAALWKSDL